MRFSLMLIVLFFPVFNDYKLIAQDIKQIKAENFGHEIYNVKPHPSAEFVKLKNGFRYILLPNKTPEKRVLVYLYVEVGSINENDNQQGIAHFIEHMAFRGTQNYSGEELSILFKKMGMSMGSDSNAHTFYDKTTYEINLPDEKYKKDALKIMADFAMNISFKPKDIEDERGVILNESRQGDNIDSRIHAQYLQFLFPNSVISSRPPIGLDSSIKTFNQNELLDFYHGWYRPENMVLIVIGDINKENWKKDIEELFKNFQATIPAIKKPEIIPPIHKGLKIKYFYEQEVKDVTISLCTVKPTSAAYSSYKSIFIQNLENTAAIHILNKRFKNTKFIENELNLSHFLNYDINEIVIQSNNNEYENAIKSIQNNLNGLIENKISNQELEIFKKKIINDLETKANAIETINNNQYMAQVINSLSKKIPFQSIVQIRDLAIPLINNLTSDEIESYFKSCWSEDHRLLFITGNLYVVNAEEKFKKLLQNSVNQELPKQEDEKLVSFPIEKKPENNSKIINTERFEELDFSRITFENNVVLNLKKTNYKKNEILININFGFGALSLPEGKEAMAHVASFIINFGGLEKISYLDLKDSLAGKNDSFNFTVGPVNCSMSSKTTPEDFELNLQLFRATLLTPGFREESFKTMKERIDQYDKELSVNISTYFKNEVNKKTYQNILLSHPKIEILNLITLKELKEWLTDEFKNTPMEINIVGDFEDSKIIETTATYFGTLPTRKKILKPKLKAISQNDAFDISETFKTSVNKALLYMMIPTTDFQNVGDTRKLNLLGYVLKNKLVSRIREKLALTYSPLATHDTILEFKDSCFFKIFADVDPKNVDVVRNEINSMLAEVVKNGISNEDLENARLPLLTEINSATKTNEYWISRVLGNSTIFPFILENAKSVLKSYETISKQEINEIAIKYLKLDKKSVYILKSINEKKNVFPYERKPDVSGKIISQEYDKEFEFNRYTFENNITLNTKTTNFNADEIILTVNFGHGTQSIPNGKEGMAHVAESAILGGGLSKISFKEIDEIFKTNKIKLVLDAEIDTFSFKVYTTNENIELCLQLIRAYLLEAAFKDESMTYVKSKIERISSTLNTNEEKYFENERNKRVFNNNHLSFYPNKQILEQITLNDLKQWLIPELNNSPIEINVVGNIDEKKILELTGSYFGSFSARPKHKPIEVASILYKNKFETIDLANKQINYSYYSIILPLKQITDSNEFLGLNIIIEGIKEKIKILFSEKLKVEFSPNIILISSDNSIINNVIKLEGTIEPLYFDYLVLTFDAVISELAEKGISSDEMKAFLAKWSEKFTQNLKKNNFWMSVLSQSSFRSFYLKQIKYEMMNSNEITKEQIDQIAKKHLQLENRSYYSLQEKEKAENILLIKNKPNGLGKIISQNEFKGLDIVRVTYDNNVVLNLKKLKDPNYKISIDLIFGAGPQSAPKGKEGLIPYAQTFINYTDLNFIFENDYKKLSIKDETSTKFSLGVRSFRFQFESTPVEFEKCLQIGRANLLNLNYNEKIFDNLKEAIIRKHKSIEINMKEYYYEKRKKLLAYHENPLVLPSKELINDANYIDLKNWLVAEFLKSPLEINIVGDIDIKETIELVSKYFGTLPSRQKIKIIEKIEPQIFEKFDISEDFNSIKKEDYILLLIPTNNYRDIIQTINLQFILEVIKNRLSAQLKAKMNSFSNFNLTYLNDDEYGNSYYIELNAKTNSSNTVLFLEIINNVLNDISSKGITPDEHLLVKSKLIDKIQKYGFSNTHWLTRILRNSSLEPIIINHQLYDIENYKNVTVEQLNECAANYLKLENRSTFTLKSKEK